MCGSTMNIYFEINIREQLYTLYNDTSSLHFSLHAVKVCETKVRNNIFENLVIILVSITEPQCAVL